MEIITLEQLETIVKDSKKQNKVIGRFGTCGGIHGGHLAGIDLIREKSDVVIVTFNDWINKLIFSMTSITGYLFTDYSDFRKEDIEILQDSNKVDYLVRVPLTDKIQKESFEIRKKLVTEIDFYRSIDVFENYKAGLGLIAGITAQWYCPEHDIVDFIAYGAKDASLVLLGEVVLREQGMGLLGTKIELYPVCRDENMYPLSSSSLLEKDPEKIRKEKELCDLFKYQYLEVIRSGKVPSFDIKNYYRFFLIEKETLSFSKEIKKGNNYYFVCLLPYFNKGMYRLYRDCLEI